jgi:hypothetical protein
MLFGDCYLGHLLEFLGRRMSGEPGWTRTSNPLISLGTQYKQTSPLFSVSYMLLYHGVWGGFAPELDPIACETSDRSTRNESRPFQLCSGQFRS